MHDQPQKTTTISESFAEHNTLITIFSSGILSIIFTFRFFRTMLDLTITTKTKRFIVLLLIFIQYTFVVVMCNNNIRGASHYLFTFLTIVSTLIYHSHVHDQYTTNETTELKNNLTIVSVCMLLGFLFFYILSTYTNVVIFNTPISDNLIWTLTCLFEICGVGLLSTLDLLDVFVFGYRLNEYHTEHAEYDY